MALVIEFTAEFLTFGGCRHLDSLEQRWFAGWLLVIVASSNQGIVRGSCAYSPWEILEKQL